MVAATLEGMPDEELLGQLTDYFQQRREIAVDVLVRAPEAVTVDVAVKIDGGADQAGAAERVKTALRQWFTGERLGQDVLRARLGSLIFGCEGGLQIIEPQRGQQLPQISPVAHCIASTVRVPSTGSWSGSKDRSSGGAVSS